VGEPRPDDHPRRGAESALIDAISGDATIINLGSCLRASAERNFRKTAFVVGRAGISYEHLDQRTTSLAEWMLHQGYKPGDRIVIHWPNSIEAVELIFACFKAEDVERERLLRALAGATFIIFFQAYMVAPIIPTLASGFETSVQTAGLVVPAYLIPYGCATLAHGLLADRIGIHRVMFVSLAAFCALSALTATARSVEELMLPPDSPISRRAS
jgi:non-ribosomal peptide synthetase component F